MVAKLIPIVIIIVLGLSLGNMNNPMEMIPGEGISPLSAFALAIVAALWAYDGWSSVYIVSEELKNPKRDLPRAVIIGVVGVTFIYVLFNFALLKVLPIAEIAATDAPASLAAESLLGKAGGIVVTVGALLAIFGSCNGCILAYPREYYAMSRDKRFFKMFAKINPKTGTPANAQIATMIIACLLIPFGTLEQLTAMVAFTAWIYYTLGVSSVFIIRRKHPDLERPYKVWAYPVLPIATILLSLVVLVTTLWEDPRNSVLGVVVSLVGWTVYHLYFKKQERKAQ